MATLKQAEKILNRARLCIEIELLELEAEAHRRFRDGRSFGGLTETMLRWKHHLTSIEEAEVLLSEIREASPKSQKPVCETIVRNLGRFIARPITLH